MTSPHDDTIDTCARPRARDIKKSMTILCDIHVISISAAARAAAIATDNDNGNNPSPASMSHHYYLMAMPYYPSPLSVSMPIYICSTAALCKVQNAPNSTVSSPSPSPSIDRVWTNLPTDNRCIINIQQPLKSSSDIVAVTFLLY